MNKIAIIEDDIDICNMIAKFLENNKYIVHYALNGAEGIELCKSLVPDLIILDIMLPKLNGNDVLQRLRKFTNAPVIVVSAKTMVQTKIDLLKLGADDYMTKPFDLHELLARIEANLKRTSNTSCQNDTLTYRDIEINSNAYLLLKGRLLFISQPCAIMLPAGFRIFYNRKSMLQTQLVIHSPDCPGRAPEVAKFFLTVQCSRVDNDVIMDMVLIHMGADNKGMVSFCELQCQLPADLISFFWRNFAGLKCLTEMVGDHIICTLISAGQICILSFGQKKLCISKPGITLIAINEFSKIGFLRIFYIINNI